MQQITSRLQFIWEKIKLHPWISSAVIVAIIIAFLAFQRFVLGMTVWANWTGLGQKTLWDLFELLIIPAALGIIARFFNKRERENELKIAEEQNQEAALQNYIDKMNELILKENLKEKKDVWEALSEKDLGKTSREKHEAVLDMAQVRTVTALRQLNKDRRNILLQFLRDAGLEDFILVSASLAHAELKHADLSFINLSEADLSGARLFMADLTGAYLHNANLYGANLREAHLSEASLDLAYLIMAGLFRADLNKAHLMGVNLSSARKTSIPLSWEDEYILTFMNPLRLTQTLLN